MLYEAGQSIDNASTRGALEAWLDTYGVNLENMSVEELKEQLDGIANTTDPSLSAEIYESTFRYWASQLYEILYPASYQAYYAEGGDLSDLDAIIAYMSEDQQQSLYDLVVDAPELIAFLMNDASVLAEIQGGSESESAGTIYTEVAKEDIYGWDLFEAWYDSGDLHASTIDSLFEYTANQATFASYWSQVINDLNNQMAEVTLALSEDGVDATVAEAELANIQGTLQFAYPMLEKGMSGTQEVMTLVTEMFKAEHETYMQQIRNQNIQT